MHADAFVIEAISLYLSESKKVSSFLFAMCKGFISLITKLFFKFIFGKSLFSFIFFFFEKNIFTHKLVKIY